MNDSSDNIEDEIHWNNLEILKSTGKLQDPKEGIGIVKFCFAEEPFNRIWWCCLPGVLPVLDLKINKTWAFEDSALSILKYFNI